MKQIRIKVAIGCLLLAGLIACALLQYLTHKSNASPTALKTTSKTTKTQPKQAPSTPTVTTAPATEPPDTPTGSIDDPNNILVVVNKLRPLSPKTYTPSDLKKPAATSGLARAVTANALDDLVVAAKQEGLSIKLISGYRSYQTQQSVYGGYVAHDGQAQADTYSARPGYSEHQTGLAADLGNTDGSCDLDQCFGQSALGQWLATNAHNYGFIIRYLDGKTNITGYKYEPWHLRYVGADTATQIYNKSQTLEEYFGLPAAPNYP